MNVPVRPPTAAPARHLFTGDDVLQMMAAGVLVEGGKFELVGGEIIDMPSEGRAHLALKEELNYFLVRNLPENLRVLPDGTLQLGERDWPEPDFYIHERSKAPGDVRGSDTLLVIEIADSSLAHDLGAKAELYRGHGVREYWVIDLAKRQLHVHRADAQWPAPPKPLTERVEPSLIPSFGVTLADFLPE